MTDRTRDTDRARCASCSQHETVERLQDDLDSALDLLEELATAYPQAASGHHPAMGHVQEANRLLARAWARRVTDDHQRVPDTAVNSSKHDDPPEMSDV